MDLILKLISEGKKPRLIMVFGDEKNFIKENIKQILKKNTGEEILVFEADPKEKEKLIFFMKNTDRPILIINQTNGYYEEIKEIIKSLPKEGFVILNFDQEPIKNFKPDAAEQFFTFGFQDESDFYASDVKIDGDISFKVNNRGNTIPFWLRLSINYNERVLAALSAAAAGTILGLNLIEISQTLKEIEAT